MILKRLILDNYCLFSGRHEFDLEPRSRNGAVRPIILFGGKNGAGKTTFLNAIQLAFYGRHSIGSRLSDREYHLALRNRVHRNHQTEKRASFARVGLEFELITQGEKHIYSIERSWTSGESKDLQEFFKAEKDGKPLDDVSPEHWQTFIADIVPERLSQLFFFDGEKIKTIAEDISSNAAISDAIQTLLGLDTVKTLQADLGIYRSKLLKAANPGLYQREVAQIDAEIAQLVTEQARLKTDAKNIENSLKDTRERIAYIEAQLQAGGADLAKLSGANNARQETLRAKQAALEQQIRIECDTAFPFALCPAITSKLIAQLQAETSLRHAKLLDNEIITLQQRLLSAAAQKLTVNGAKDLKAFLADELNHFRNSRQTAHGVVEVHALSDRDTASAIETIQNQAPASVKRLREILADLESVVNELRQVTKDIAKAPEQLELQSPFARLQEQNQILGQEEEKKRHNAEDLHQVELTIAGKARQKRLAESKLDKARDVAAKTTYIEKLQPALAAYMDRLTRAKIAALQSEVTECYNRLARKTDFVRRVEINPDDFSVAVIDKFGRSIPKEDLSSGEKQIFAIAMLWGLARTSGRPLPVVIDTPLGRLDSDHRKNLIQNYFPHAGHQVILLSTDTEVDMPLFKDLSSAVSHCYHLRYDEQEDRTYAETQYFWKV